MKLPMKLSTLSYLLALTAARSAAAQLRKNKGKGKGEADSPNKVDCRTMHSFALKKECERTHTVTPNIINGDDAPVGAYPWFARLTRGAGWSGCGGSLVHKRWVLTAAHCVPVNPTGAQIGALQAPYQEDDNGGQDVQHREVDMRIKHPNYSSSTLDNDIALLRLSEAATIAPVPMDLSDIVGNYAANKTNLWPVGFGVTETGATTQRLQHVNVDFVPQATCAAAYGGMNAVTESMFCAADEYQDSCQGDSGGPIYDEDEHTLVGVVSWGIGCARKEYPGVYARISAQAEWIRETICTNTNVDDLSDDDFCSTFAPTPAPISPPTPAPTACEGELVTVKITTDDYPGETTWEIKNNCADEVQKRVGPYSDQGADYVHEVCIPSQKEYTFTIGDAYGDGICCDYGQGSFDVTLADGTVVVAGGEFRGSISKTWGSCAASPSPSISPLASASTSPSASPSASGTDAPTLSPTEPPSDATSRSFIYALSNDNRNFCGYDVHWAPKCNGRLASIKNSNELDLAKMLLARHPEVRVGGISGSAWIGGMYDSQKSQWGWSDGTTWFDDDEKLWNASPVPTGPRSLLKMDGAGYRYQSISSGYCGPGKKGAAIVILPADYDDPNAVFYQTHDFAKCQDFKRSIIDTVAIV